MHPSVNRHPRPQRGWRFSLYTTQIVFRRKTVGAYRIRPEKSENGTNPSPNIPKISIEQVWGRIAYALTAAHRKPQHQTSHHSTYTFAHMKGVCDTPLHLFAQNMDRMIPNVGEQKTIAPNIPIIGLAPSLTWRAYAIRPYTCSLNTWISRSLNKQPHHQINTFAHLKGVCDTPLHLFA